MWFTLGPGDPASGAWVPVWRIRLASRPLHLGIVLYRLVKRNWNFNLAASSISAFFDINLACSNQVSERVRMSGCSSVQDPWHLQSICNGSSDQWNRQSGPLNTAIYLTHPLRFAMHATRHFSRPCSLGKEVSRLRHELSC